ncbi:polysaccharide deacetylase family protein [Mycolicibacterium smegmatis]|uniref:Polysaccharide deacetylase n=2 Tax=Mycolicibacterium smegmatis (strain ATCC 700084 / mc(2)155) TaxID=246196 RepID=A0QRD1_MYCS2|nr:polysaccharide deacetylase [Mycolicibacterium smegmatis]ABK75501.1 polysaccharide deacetylase [Mycolicibacterium smegmatis MC2 155]AFP37520.1 Polysaccharide deacetylase [Mycolicibacterium smegmatis MC2 155]AIU06323.1 polysaccharide deacetylase [Mycolicibacterium smegmatis MC2 155]AIU12948.1 polysaccharide deacetylase [Mycolicibacterium smegmatis]AIU19572.1 polysaccharide deacetylase [Mycolicibacterium smegmatis]
MASESAPGLVWPEGKVAAAAFTFDVDAESAILWGNEAVGARMSVMSHQAYGPLVGVPRILDLLDRHQIASTFFVPGHTAHRYPDAVRAIVAAGHEVAHHGYLHEQPTALTLEEEIEALDRGLEALAEVAGVTPAGYRAPMWDLSWHTPGLLAERNFLYDSSLMDADVPYELAVGDTSLVEIPIQWALDDWEQYCFLPDISGSGLIESPRKARELWQLEFDALRRAGGCWVLTNHPFLSGRASRAAELDDLMRYVTEHADVWTTNLGTLARHVRAQGLTPRSITQPGK